MMPPTGGGGVGTVAMTPQQHLALVHRQYLEEQNLREQRNFQCAEEQARADFDRQMQHNGFFAAGSAQARPSNSRALTIDPPRPYQNIAPKGYPPPQRPYQPATANNHLFASAAAHAAGGGGDGGGGGIAAFLAGGGNINHHTNAPAAGAYSYGNPGSYEVRHDNHQ